MFNSNTRIGYQLLLFNTRVPIQSIRGNNFNIQYNIDLCVPIILQLTQIGLINQMMVYVLTGYKHICYNGRIKHAHSLCLYACRPTHEQSHHLSPRKWATEAITKV